MLKLESISIELKKYNQEVNHIFIKELIDMIDQEVKEQTAATKPSEKKQLAAIKKYLNRIPESRPILKTWSPFGNNQLVFTNSYSLIILNKKTLPFKVSFAGDVTPEKQDQFIKENNIEKKDVVPGCYPNIKNILPDEMEQLDTLKLDVESFNAWYKVQDKKALKNKDVLYNLSDDLNPYTVDAILLKELVDILQLKNKVCIEYYGSIKPCIIRTEAGKNIGLLLPVKKY